MATTVEQATGSARVLNVGGKDYYITPMPAQAWGEYLGWLKDEWFSAIKRNVADLAPDIQERLLATSLKRFGTIGMGDPELEAIADSPGGVFRLVRMHLTPRHPEMTEQNVADLLNSPELQAQALAKIDAVMEIPRPKARRVPKKKGSTKAQRRAPKSRKKR